MRAIRPPLPRALCGGVGLKEAHMNYRHRRRRNLRAHARAEFEGAKHSVPRLRGCAGDQGARRRHHGAAARHARVLPRSVSATRCCKRRHRECRKLLLQPLRPAHLQGAARQGWRATATPEVGIHRGTLHLALYRAVHERLGADAVRHQPPVRRRRAGRERRAVCCSRRPPPARRSPPVARRRRDRLRRRELGAPQAALSATMSCSPASTPGAV